jgi:hypothetical protein
MNTHKHTKLPYLLFLLLHSLTLLTNPIKLHPATLQSLKRATLNRYTSRRLSQSSSQVEKDNRPLPKQKILV